MLARRAAAILLSFALVMVALVAADGGVRAATPFDPAHWEERQPGFGGLTLDKVVMPGTHDSGTFSIPDSIFARGGTYQQDVPAILLWVVPHNIIAGMAIAEKQDFAQQLDGGIRVLDLRFDCEDDDIFFVHALLGEKMSVGLAQIAAWTKAHPRELVLLDVNADYNCNNATYGGVRGTNVILSTFSSDFGSTLVPRPAADASPTVSNFLDAGTNVIVFDNNPTAVTDSAGLYWPQLISKTPGNLIRNYFAVSDMSTVLTMNLADAWNYVGRPSTVPLWMSATTTMLLDVNGAINCVVHLLQCQLNLVLFVNNFVFPVLDAGIPQMARAGFNLIVTDTYEDYHYKGMSFPEYVVAQNPVPPPPPPPPPSTTTTTTTTSLPAPPVPTTGPALGDHNLRMVRQVAAMAGPAAARTRRRARVALVDFIRLLHLVPVG